MISIISESVKEVIFVLSDRGAWSLVCSTEEQWVNLAESIKDKISPQDRHLYRIITQNFLPEISNMIEQKVRLFTLSDYIFFFFYKL